MSVAIPPAERSVNDWEAIFSASNMATFSSEQMLQSIKELLKFMSKRCSSTCQQVLAKIVHDNKHALATLVFYLMETCRHVR